jgi:hypothetical protein
VCVHVCVCACVCACVCVCVCVCVCADSGRMALPSGGTRRDRSDVAMIDELNALLASRPAPRMLTAAEMRKVQEDHENAVAAAAARAAAMAPKRTAAAAVDAGAAKRGLAGTAATPPDSDDEFKSDINSPPTNIPKCADNNSQSRLASSCSSISSVATSAILMPSDAVPITIDRESSVTSVRSPTSSSSHSDWSSSISNPMRESTHCQRSTWPTRGDSKEENKIEVEEQLSEFASGSSASSDSEIEVAGNRVVTKRTFYFSFFS